jgi:hypothetical protein
LLGSASKRRCKKNTKVYEEGKGKRVIRLEFKSDVSADIVILIAAVMLWHFPFSLLLLFLLFLWYYIKS